MRQVQQEILQEEKEEIILLNLNLHHHPKRKTKGQDRCKVEKNYHQLIP